MGSPRYPEGPTGVDSFSDLIGQPGKWLLPLEVQMIAEAFDQPIAFYNNHGRGEPAYESTFNPSGGNDLVRIYFNGSNHFEQVMAKSPEELTGLGDSIQESDALDDELEVVDACADCLSQNVHLIDDAWMDADVGMEGSGYFTPPSSPRRAGDGSFSMSPF